MPKRSPLIYISLILLTLLTFSPTLRNNFTTWDDNDTLAQNPDLNPVTPSSFTHFWTKPQADLYAPLTYSLWAALTPLARTATNTLNPAPYHALNLLLHLTSVLLTYRLLHRLTANPLGSAFGAALFAIHPVQVETVAWASGTKDLLAALFSLAALNLYCSNWKTRRYALATLCYACALLSKPSAVTLPLTAFALSHFLLHTPWSKSLLTLTPWLLMAIPIVIIGKLSQPAHALPFVPPIFSRPIIALDAIAFYLHQLIAPLSLCIDYGRSPLAVLSSPHTALITPLVLLFFAGLWFLRRTVVLPSTLLFLATLLPVLGLVPFDFQQYSTVADHYLYLTLLAPALLLARLLSSAYGHAKVRHSERSEESRPLASLGVTHVKRPLRITTAHLSASILLILFAIRSFTQSQTWLNSTTLFTHAITVNPHDPLPHTNLALALSDAGQHSQAIAEYRTALSLNFADPRAHLGLGQTLARLGQPEEAAAHLRLAATLEPTNPLPHYNLALLFDSLGQPDAALPEYEQSLTLDPNFAEAHTNLATLLLSRGDLDAAEHHYRAALATRPDLTLPRRGLEAIAQARSQSR